MKNFLTIIGKFSCVFALALLLTFSSFAQVKLRRALDYNGDNKADFTIFRPSNAVWFIYTSGNTYISQQFGIFSEDFMTPGDYDGDGKGDISVWRETTGYWFRLNSSNNTFTAVQFGQIADEPVARDYDGDGKTDIAVVRRTNGTMIWYILKSSDSGFQSTQFGAATDFTAPGDYDGDGKFDFAVQRPGATNTSPSNFFILTATGAFSQTQFGQSNDLIAPGDYDGDGKTDLAVIREGATSESNLNWFILQSTNNTIRAVPFGATGTDLNVQNDYDGDGKTDIAVWRDTNGTFYVLRSTDGGFTVVQWGAPNDYPVASYDTH